MGRRISRRRRWKKLKETNGWRRTAWAESRRRTQSGGNVRVCFSLLFCCCYADAVPFLQSFHQLPQSLFHFQSHIPPSNYLIS
jgi:hypothetical protein